MIDFASLLLEHPAWNQLGDEMEQDVFRAWKRSKDAEEREQLWHQLKALGEIRRKIRAKVRTDAGQPDLSDQ
jgi:hypothetical protein